MERIQYPLRLAKDEYHVSCRGLLYEVQNLRPDKGWKKDCHVKRTHAYGRLLFPARLYRQDLKDHRLIVGRELTELV